MPQSLALFAVCAVLVALAGVRLAHAGDEVAERLGIPRLFVGMLLVAGATSLPELVTGVTAVLSDAPDLAVGDLLGAGMANMAILAVLELSHRQRVWAHLEVGHARVASVSIALMAFVALALLTPTSPQVGWVGLDTIVLGTGYVAAVRWMKRSPSSRFATDSVLPRPLGWSQPETDGNARSSVIRLLLAALVILVAAPVLVLSAEEIAARTGLGETFVGVAFLAMTTSMPELVASLAAVRIGSFDLAVGNLFGSSSFNVAALLIVDLAYVDGPLLAAVAASQVVAAVGAVLLMAMALAVIVHGHETRLGHLEPDAMLVLLAYAGVLYGIWAVRQ